MKDSITHASHDRSCISGSAAGPLPPLPPAPPPAPPPDPPAVCEPVKRPGPPGRVPLPLGKQPHLVTLLVDDLGFDDLRSHGVNAGEVLTPAAMELVREGILLDRHHSYMWCSPTRRSFLTGRYPVHVSGMQAPTDSNLTPLQFTILSEKLAAAGVSAHFVGKGHLGWITTDNLLVHRGFGSHVGYLGGSEDYRWGGTGSSVDSPDPYVGRHDMWHNSTIGADVVPLIYYSTEFYTSYAVDKIEHHNITRPLWIHVAYQAMHGGGSRSDPPEQDVIDPVKIGFRDQGYGNALRSLDNGIANITSALKRTGLWDNTLLVIMADNGGDNPGGSCSNHPLLGRKCLAWEGGTRVYAAVAGGLVPPKLRGTVNSELMHIADWYPTFSRLVGVDPEDDWTDENGTVHSIDGVDLLPVLFSGAPAPRQWLPTTPQSIIHTDGTGAMWKLITLETQTVRFLANGTTIEDTHNPCLSPTTVFDCVDSLDEHGGGGRDSCHVCTPASPCLYDVATDPGETRNVAASHPALVRQMATELARYQSPIVLKMALTPANLACYDCASPRVPGFWRNYTGPSCVRRKP